MPYEFRNLQKRGRFELDEGSEDAIRDELVDMGLNEDTIEEALALARQGRSFEVTEDGTITVMAGPVRTRT